MKLVGLKKDFDYILYAQRALDDALAIFTEFDVHETNTLGISELTEIFNCLGLNDPNNNGFRTFLAKEFEAIGKAIMERIEFDEFVDFYNNLLSAA